jgi:hypothetical protein
MTLSEILGFNLEIYLVSEIAGVHEQSYLAVLRISRLGSFKVRNTNMDHDLLLTEQSEGHTLTFLLE